MYSISYKLMNSPWPIIISLYIMNFFLGMLFKMKYKIYWNSMVYFFFLFMFFIMMKWLLNIFFEANLKGLFNFFCYSNLKWGMLLFITSEVMFFFSFFWSYFHFSLSFSIFLGNMWPPYNIESISPLGLPILNSLILLSSGVTLTVSHNLLFLKNYKKIKNFLMMTILLGFSFLFIQFYEYNLSSFYFSISIYSVAFFMLTGFHGFHVLVGVIFLLFNYFRLKKFLFNYLNFYSFEFSIWYWHFVDVVWLFLYFFVYF